MGKKIYFHIGFGKTGSTALQACLRKYQNMLKDNDYEYINLPLVFFDSIHSLFKKYISGENDIITWFYNNFFTDEERERFATKADRVKLTDQINKLISKSAKNNMIFSWEGLMDFRKDLLFDKVSLLSQILTDWDDVTLIIYIRRQCRFIRSNYQLIFRPQYEVSFDQYFNAFDFISSSKESYTLNYYELIKVIEEVFPRAKIIVKAYDLIVKKTDLFRDLCNDLNISKLPKHIKSQRINQSLSFPSFAAMSLSKDVLSKEQALDLYSVLVQTPIESEFMRYNFPTLEQNNQIMSYYEESNRMLFEKYSLGSHDDFKMWQNVEEADNGLTVVMKNKLYEDIIAYLLKYSQQGLLSSISGKASFSALWSKIKISLIRKKSSICKCLV